MNEAAAKGSDEKFCFSCGAVIKAAAELCVHCGVRQPGAAPVNMMGIAANGRSRVVAAVFAIFLGAFGVHKFYLGRIGLGILYLLFCWTGIPSLVGFIEGVLLLVMTNEEFDRKYGH